MGLQASGGCHACDSELREGFHNLPHMKRVLYLPHYPGKADTEGLEPTTSRLTAGRSAN